MHHLTPLCLFLCWMLPVGSKKVLISIFTLQDDKQPIQLSMVKDAVDDMYDGCTETMEHMVQNKYFTEENTKTFANLWDKANDCAGNSLKKREKGDERLTKNHMQAICVYTNNADFKKGKFYQHFNNEVRTMGTKYPTSFKFKSLHFWLTSAIQILRNDKKCITTYRRTSNVFAGEVNQKIRFGFFASSSFRSDLTRFGSKTCFKINTCQGAFLKNYTYLSGKEQEVLIPPYEMFTITKVIKNKFVEHLSDCNNVYVLKSAGIQSNLNCRASK